MKYKYNTYNNSPISLVLKIAYFKMRIITSTAEKHFFKLNNYVDMINHKELWGLDTEAVGGHAASSAFI